MKNKKTMVKLPNGNWVNPEHVTCIECKKYPNSIITSLWVKMSGGYGTSNFDFPGDCRDSLAKIINQE